MERALEQLVWSRAHDCCEYCQFPSEFSEATFEIDHILAQKHGGLTVAENLALSCYYCNTYKGPNVAGIDSTTGRAARLFNPRRDRWNQHFMWRGGLLMPRSAIGRVTIDVLRMNDPMQIGIREILIECGVFPPSVLRKK